MGSLDAPFRHSPADQPVVDAAEPRRIRDEGTSDALWAAWRGLDDLTSIPIEKWMHPGARLVVVAPHPDDEVLACGGLMALHALRGGHTVVIAVTDGEASHGRTESGQTAQLARRRLAERNQGLSSLGCSGADVHRLGLPDGGVAGAENALQEQLAGLIQWGDIVVTTWRLDGHPDHEACGRAAARVCATARCRLLEAPVWMWQWSQPGDGQVPWHRLVALPLSPQAVTRKQRALAAHASQLEARSPGAGPVLGQTMLDRLARRSEYFFV